MRDVWQIVVSRVLRLLRVARECATTWRHSPQTWRRRTFWVATAFLAFLIPYSAFLFVRISLRMDRYVWDVPSRVYAAPMVLYRGLGIDRSRLISHLRSLGYWEVADSPERPGEFDAQGSRIDIHLRERETAEGTQRAERVRIVLSGSAVRELSGAASKKGEAQSLDFVELDPMPIARIYADVREEREIVPLDELPPQLVNAIIAVEDKRYFGHLGLSPRGIARALWANLRAGRTAEGGSTITQQLVKNLFLTHKRTLTRKVNEALMAVIVELRYSKKTVLNAYVNEIYLGQSGSISISGVGAAARFYFGKDVRSLTLAESALLAGMIRSPFRYSFLNDPQRARDRRQFVLTRLVEEGKISAQERASAVDAPLPKEGHPVAARSVPFVVDAIRAEVPISSERLSKRGYRIYTSLDSTLQSAAELAVRQQAKRLTRNGSHPELAFAAMNAHTGTITALVGGVDYGTSQFNRVYLAMRQPGSAFKPIVYAAALERAIERDPKRFTPTTLLKDSRLVMTAGGKEWSPRNPHGGYLGDVTVRVSVEDSLNVPAVRVADSVGLRRVVELAYGLGIRRELPEVPSIALGSAEVMPIELLEAYGAFAGNGARVAPYIVRRVVDAKGKQVYRGTTAYRRVLSPQSAYLLTHLLEGVLDRGTGASSRSWGFRSVGAGKTGTTNDGRDAWFVGYTPETVALAWAGYDDSRPFGMSGARAALPVWAQAMAAYARSRPRRSFVVPQGIVFRRVCRFNGLLANEACPVTVEEAFIEGTQPKEVCAHHEILPEPAELAEEDAEALEQEALLLAAPSSEFVGGSELDLSPVAPPPLRATYVADQIEAAAVVAETIYAKTIEADVLEAPNVKPYQSPPVDPGISQASGRENGIFATRVVARRIYASYVKAETIYAEKVIVGGEAR